MVLKLKLRAAFLSIALVVLWHTSAAAQTDGPHGLAVFKNMQKDAAVAGKSCLPMVVMVSQFSCAYCEKLREQVLLPLLKSGEFDNKALFRELLIDPDEFVINLAGQSVTGMHVANEYLENIVTPTMLIIDSSGNELVERIVGISNIDFYSAYLETQIKTAYQKSKAGCSKNQVEK